MSLVALGISHSPLKGILRPENEFAEPAHDAALRRTAEWIKHFDPELLVLFGPDHYRGFFNDLMPCFCIGIRAQGLGDWETSTGPIIVPEDIALNCARYLHQRDVDVAFSYDMHVDHGFVQPLDWLGLGLRTYPLLPVFVNCWAEPLPSFNRVRKLGSEMGAFLASLDRRVLVMASGGLSHDPPVPKMRGASPELQRRLTVRQRFTHEDLKEMSSNVTAAARDLVSGRSKHLRPDEEWDRKFLSILARQELDTLDSLESGIEAVAGAGANEVRTWIAAFSALQTAAGPYESEILYQRSVPEWLTGMGIMLAVPTAHAAVA
jgi:2,3-dihydroxyphenylpropionate 1,2-dioxygenase